MPRISLTYALAALLLALLLTVTGCATIKPQMVHQDKNVTVRLFSEPCANDKVLEHIEPEYQPRFHAGVSTWQGADFQLCWTVVDDQVFVVDETGDSGTVPVVGFKRV